MKQYARRSPRNRAENVDAERVFRLPVTVSAMHDTRPVAVGVDKVRLLRIPLTVWDPNHVHFTLVDYPNNRVRRRFRLDASWVIPGSAGTSVATQDRRAGGALPIVKHVA